MEVPPQIPDQATRLTCLPRSVAVADARSALDALIGAHVIDERDKAVIKDGEVEAE